MKLATVRLPGRTACVRIDGDQAVETGHGDLGDLLRESQWRDLASTADGRVHAAAQLVYAPLVTAPTKILCTGLNYRSHAEEMGMDIPEHPTLFAKLADTLTGAHDLLIQPSVSEALDWEAELAIVIGYEVRHADRHAAASAIAGYSVLNDVSVRDWQFRTTQWDQGKIFERTSPLGPAMATTDEFDPAAGYSITCDVDDQRVQHGNTSDFIFDPPTLVSYISAIVTLRPGDIIATGTPSGVGHSFLPPRYLMPGQTLTTSIEGIGLCRNVVQPSQTVPAGLLES